MQQLTVVTSVYNGAESFKIFAEGIHRLYLSISEDWRLKLIVIDDASSDISWEVVKLECNALRNLGIEVNAFQQYLNQGQHRSLFDGINIACQDDCYLAIIDGDGEENPELIKHLLELMQAENFDVVISIQENRDKSLIRGYLGRIGWRLIEIMQTSQVNTNECTLRVLNPRAAQLLNSVKHPNPILGRVQSQLGFRTGKIQIEKKYKGFSSYNFYTRLKLFYKNLTYSNAIFIQLSRLTLLLGILFGVSSTIFFVLYYIKTNNPLAGYTSTGLLVSILFSINFIILSMMTKLMISNFDRSTAPNRLFRDSNG